MTTQGLISIVVPVYNEADAVAAFLKELASATAGASGGFPAGYEVIFANDGSTDDTRERLLAERERNPAIGIVSLSRNFGKEAAIVAGLEASRGDAAIIMDVDLQDPPALIPEMVAKWRSGAEVVIALRSDRSSDGVLKRISANLFYKAFGLVSEVKLPPGAGDFRLLDRRVIEAFLRLDERARFNKGLLAWLGFRQAFVRHVRPAASRGSRWTFHRLYRFGFGGIVSFSTVPIRVWGGVGAVIALLAVAYGAYLVVRTLIFGVDLPGYASVMVSVLFLGGVNLFTLGLVGEYVGQVLTEAKRRPIYIVRERVEAEPHHTSAEAETH